MENEVDNLLNELDEYKENDMLTEDDYSLFKELVLDAQSIQELSAIRDSIPEAIDEKEGLDRVLEKDISIEKVAENLCIKTTNHVCLSQKNKSRISRYRNGYLSRSYKLYCYRKR